MFVPEPEDVGVLSRNAAYDELSMDQCGAVDVILDDMRRQARGLFFLTGAAGSGKSHVVRYLARHDQAVVTAYTGIAAQLIGGVTIHAAVGWRPHTPVPNQAIQAGNMYSSSLLIIDEVSMLDAKLLQDICVNRTLSDKSYTILLVGDFLQLPPVNKPWDKKFPCFTAPVWKQRKRIILTTQHRQNDPEFVAVLNDMRVGCITDRYRALVAERNKIPVPDDVPRIMVDNKSVDDVNHKYLKTLAMKNKHMLAEAGYHSQNLDPAHKTEIFKNRARLPKILWLVEEARVMFQINAEHWKNGTLGTIHSIPSAQGEPMLVRLDSGETVEVVPMKEEFIRPNGALETTITQYPIKPARAHTVHKSQGQTYDKAFVDLTKEHFAPGQKYVAFSRVKTKAGLYLKGSNLDLIVDPTSLRESGVIL